jgi:branched-chain amino acid transport system permease protein
MEKMKALCKRNIAFPIFALFFLVVTLLHQLGIVNSYFMQVMMLACIYIIMAESLNILNGMTGLSSLGQAGFMSVGAYSSAIFTTYILHVSSLPEPLQVVAFVAATLVGAVMAAICGVLIGIPALRLRGDYLAIVTLGFCEVIRAIWRVVPADIAGGAFGLTGIPKLANFFWAFLFMILSLYFCRNYMDSSFGRACLAIRDNEIAADTMGIDCFRYKTIAFASSAFIAGVAGSLYAHLLSYIHPDVFSYAKSSDFLVYLYAGGVGSISGAMLGALALTVLPELLRFLNDWRLVIYGALLLCIILFRPTGLFGGREFAFLQLKTGGIRVFHVSTFTNWVKGLFRGEKRVKEGAGK